MTDLTFTTDTAALDWEHGLIAGSGRIGAVLYGPPERLVVSLSHERFFLPANPRPPAPDIAGALPGIAQAVLAQDGALADTRLGEAARDAGFDGGLVWTDPLGICATLTIETPGGVRDHQRTIDLEAGEIAVSWRDCEGARHEVRVICPRGEETAWIALESESTIAVGLTLALDAATAPDAPTFAPDYAGVVSATARGGADAVVDTHGPDGAVVSRVIASGEATWRSTERTDAVQTALELTPGTPSLVQLTVGTGDGLPAAAPAGGAAGPRPAWSETREKQRGSHGELVRRSLLRLDGAAGATTEETWRAAHAGDTAARRAAIEIAYASGRAHAISATGELPPTLQGVWQGTWTPAWSADYTMNGNVQNGGIASLIPTGTPELAGSLLRLVLPFLDDYRENARRIYGADGMLLPSRMSTHGKADHFNTAFPHVFWTGCGGWVLRFAADIVATTGERALVDDELWQLVTGVLEFAETAMTEADGRLRLVPGYSPENSPVPGGSALVADPTVDIAILRDAARSSRILGAARGDDSLTARWDTLLERLPAYRVADDGTLAEWIAPLWPENIAHRHASQLYPLWYDIDPAFDERVSGEAARALRHAAGETIRAKLAWRAEDPAAPPGRMEMAFGLVQLGIAAAALGDAASALTCVEWLTLDHWRPSLTSTHDAGSIFNLDASGGLPAVVASMLVGSTMDSLTLFPALPAAWPTGSVTGLRARGGIVVERLEWNASGAAATVRRVPGAEWLAPDGLLRVAVGDSFVPSENGPSPTTITVGTDPVTMRFDRAATSSGPAH